MSVEPRANTLMPHCRPAEHVTCRKGAEAVRCILPPSLPRRLHWFQVSSSNRQLRRGAVDEVSDKIIETWTLKRKMNRDIILVKTLQTNYPPNIPSPIKIQKTTTTNKTIIVCDKIDQLITLNVNISLIKSMPIGYNSKSDWLIDWLIGWLIDWSNHLFKLTVHFHLLTRSTQSDKACPKTAYKKLCLILFSKKTKPLY